MDVFDGIVDSLVFAVPFEAMSDIRSKAQAMIAASTVLCSLIVALVPRASGVAPDQQTCLEFVAGLPWSELRVLYSDQAIAWTRGMLCDLVVSTTDCG